MWHTVGKTNQNVYNFERTAFRASCLLRLLISMLKPTSVQNVFQIRLEHISIWILGGPFNTKLGQKLSVNMGWSIKIRQLLAF